MDTTGLNDTQIGLILNDLVPSNTVANGTTARIHCTTLSGASVTGIDITAVTTKSFIAVDAAGVQMNLLQDIGFEAQLALHLCLSIKGIRDIAVIGHLAQSVVR